MIRHILVVLVAWTLLAPTVAEATGEPSRGSDYDMARKAAAIIVVQRQGPQGIHWFGGSGVLVDAERGYVLTARHNLEPRTSASKILCSFFHTEAFSRQLMPDEIASLYASEQLHATVIEEDARNDIALLKLPRVPVGVTAVPIGSESVKIGQRVHGVLAPHQLMNTYYEGYVNNVVTYVNLAASEHFKPDRLFGYTSPIAGGASGGMVLDGQGRLIGITVASVYEMSTGIAVPIDIVLKEFQSLRPERQ